MIELGFHCLMFAENVRYEFKRDYYEILSQIFNRDELKLTNVALCPEFMEERKSSDVIALLQQSDNKNSIRSTLVFEKEDNKSAIERKVTVKQSKEEDFEDLQFDRIK